MRCSVQHVWAGVLVALLAVSCGKDHNTTAAAGGPHKIDVVCTICNAKTVMHLPESAEEETWPKECPSCARWGAYACEVCPHCRKPIPLMDPRTRGYARPAVCNSCGRAWQVEKTNP